MEIIKIRLPWSNVHLILGDRPVLTDSGSRGDLARIVAALHAYGADPKFASYRFAGLWTSVSIG